MARSLAVALAFVAMANPAPAVQTSMQLTGASFVEACTRADENWVSFCNGYIQAAVDSLKVPGTVCLPAGTSRTELVTLVESVISGTPELQRMNAFHAVQIVLDSYYRCGD